MAKPREAAQLLTFQGDKYSRGGSTKAAEWRCLRHLPSHHSLATLGQLISMQRITGQTQASSRVHLHEVILAKNKKKNRAKLMIRALPLEWRGNKR